MHSDALHPFLGFEQSERGYGHAVAFGQHLADHSGKLLAQQRHILRLPLKAST